MLDGEREDDGVIITTVFDGITEKTYVILLDAITFTVRVHQILR